MYRRKGDRYELGGGGGEEGWKEEGRKEGWKEGSHAALFECWVGGDGIGGSRVLFCWWWEDRRVGDVLSWLGGDGWVERVGVLEIRFVVGFPLVVVSSGKDIVTFLKLALLGFEGGNGFCGNIPQTASLTYRSTR